MVNFEQQYQRDGAAAAPPGNLAILDKIEPHAVGIQDFFAKYSGATFNNGIYRVFAVSELKKWIGIVETMFPAYKGKMLVFGSDWYGRIFALDARRLDDNKQYQILLFDPVSGEDLKAPCNFAGFHEEELCEYASESLLVELYQNWLSAGQPAPQRDECVGYIKPLFLGGVDEISNQEITDMEVYWSICTQVWQKVQSLKAGTKIDKVDLE